MDETIKWCRSTEQLPDAELTVLACHEDQVFLAWRDDEDGWRDCASGGAAVVTWWASVEGPL